MNRILYFSTVWCGPCKAFKPLVNESISETGVNVEYIDADASRDLAMKYGISSVPTMIVVDPNGNIVRRHSGVMAKPQLLKFMGK
jgi:thioredoxin 1